MPGVARSPSSREPYERASKDGRNILKDCSTTSHQSPLCQEKARKNGHRALSGMLAYGFHASSFIVPAPRVTPGPPAHRHCSRAACPAPSTHLEETLLKHFHGTRPGHALPLAEVGPQQPPVYPQGAMLTPGASVLLMGIWDWDDESNPS